ncbi:hypothetical protein Tco_0195904 [Tanacetum coccineum]
MSLMCGVGSHSLVLNSLADVIVGCMDHDMGYTLLTDRTLTFDSSCNIIYSVWLGHEFPLPGSDSQSWLEYSPCGCGLADPLPSDDVVDFNLIDWLNEMGLLDFVKSSNPFKVKVGERTIGEEEVPLSKETEDMVISPFCDIIRIVDHTIVDELKSAAGKKKKSVVFNDGLPRMKKANGSSSFVSPERNPTTAYKTPVVLKKFVTQSSQQDIGSGPATAAMDEFVSSSVTPTPDHDSPSAELVNTNLFASLKSASPKFVKSAETNQQRDAEIASLKSKLEKADGEAMAVIRLHGRVFELEAAAVARANELVDIGARNAELLGHVSGLESLCDGLKDQVSKLESEWRCNADLDARLSVLNYYMDSELYPHMLTDVADRRWMIGHGLRLAFMKCSQSLEYQSALSKANF